jgi:hypothetical protein
MPAVRLLHFTAGHGARVSKLKDFEFRVWIQYLSSADDFGVLRFDARKIKADSDALGCRSERSIVAALERLEKLELVRSFEYQGRRFLYQTDWQDYQKVTFPSKTINPPVPPSELEHCTEATQLLLSFHPGGKRLPKKALPTTEELQNNFETSSEELQSPRVLLTANSQLLTADAPLKKEKSSNRDKWLLELWTAYPSNRRSRSKITTDLFNDQFDKDPRVDEAVWSDMWQGLLSQKAGYEWRVKGIVHSMDNWLEKELWRNRHEVAPTETLVSDKTARTLSSLAEFVKDGTR